MNSEAVEELKEELAKADGGNLYPASADDLERARQFGFPDVLLAFYLESAPNPLDGRVELNQRIWSVQRAIEENRDYVPGAYLFPLGYVVFASNKFGDAYCIDTVHVTPTGEYSVALLPHDVFEEGASSADVEPYHQIVALNLEDFLRKFARRTLTENPKYS
jgi:hypothetical protein